MQVGYASHIPHGGVHLPRKRNYSFRAFYITVLIISFLAVISVVADQGARYRYRVQSGVIERRSLEQLAGVLSKRQENMEVQDATTRYLYSHSIDVLHFFEYLDFLNLC